MSEYLSPDILIFISFVHSFQFLDHANIKLYRCPTLIKGCCKVHILHQRYDLILVTDHLVTVLLLANPCWQILGFINVQAVIDELGAKHVHHVNVGYGMLSEHVLQIG